MQHLNNQLKNCRLSGPFLFNHFRFPLYITKKTLHPHLEHDLTNATGDHEGPRQEGEERQQQLNDVVTQRLQLVNHLGGLVQVIRHWVGHWLGLCEAG